MTDGVSSKAATARDIGELVARLRNRGSQVGATLDLAGEQRARDRYLVFLRAPELLSSTRGSRGRAEARFRR